VHWFNLGPGKCLFALFLLKLSRIECFQDIPMGKFGPTVLNFGHDFFSVSHFFWDTLYSKVIILVVQRQRTLFCVLLADLKRGKSCT